MYVLNLGVERLNSYRLLVWVVEVETSCGKNRIQPSGLGLDCLLRASCQIDRSRHLSVYVHERLMGSQELHSFGQKSWDNLTIPYDTSSCAILQPFRSLEWGEGLGLKPPSPLLCAAPAFKASLHVRRKHKHKHKHKPRVNRDDASTRKRNALFFLVLSTLVVLASSPFTRGLCLCLCFCLCLRRTCKSAFRKRCSEEGRCKFRMRSLPWATQCLDSCVSFPNISCNISFWTF